MSKPFIPQDFEIPNLLETDKFRIRPLTATDVKKDYEAVMSSVEHLRAAPTPPSCGDWPSQNLTLEQDLKDLKWHQGEFQKRSSFAYTVMTPDENQCLGCVYIFPSHKSGLDAEVYMWVKKSAYDEGLDPILCETVKKWITEKWPFKKVASPGREIDWETWKSLK